jgi:hypothetical protein
MMYNSFEPRVTLKIPALLALHCGKVGGPACGNCFIFIFIRTSDLSPFYVTSSVCTVNRDPSRNFTIVPPSSRPVQGKRLEAASTHLAPSSLESRQWASSHQQHHFFSILARTRFAPFLEFLILFRRSFCTLRLGTTFLSLYSESALRLLDYRPIYRTYVPGISLFHTIIVVNATYQENAKKTAKSWAV